MSQFLNTVYEGYLKLANPNDCIEYIIRHPVLLSPGRWPDIEDVMFAVSGEEEEAAASVSYNFLQKVYEAFNEDKQRYMLGSGPLEPIIDCCDRDEISISTACGLASNHDLCLLLSPLYISKICRYADSILTEDDESWRSAENLLSIAQSAVESIPAEERIGEEWFDMWSRVIVSRIEMTTLELMHIPDKRKLDKVVLLGEQALKLANTAERQQREGKLLYRLGVLHLDPWFGGKSSSHYMNQFWQWQRKIYNFNYLIVGAEPKEIEMPEPLEALCEAKKYLEKAVTKQEKLEKAFTLKALTDTYMWLHVLKEEKSTDKINETAGKALAIMEEFEYTGDHYTVLLNIISFFNKQLQKKITPEKNPILKQLEEESAETLLENFGLISLFDIASQNINMIISQDAKLALCIWQKEQLVLDDNKTDELAEQHYKIGMQVMRHLFGITDYLEKISATSTIGIYNEVVGNVISSGGLFTVTDYAVLLDTAFTSTSRDEEEDGIAILKNVANDAFGFPELQPFVSLCNYMTAHLWLNAAVNKISANDIIGATERYIRSMGLFLKLGYSRISHNILLRIEDIIKSDSLVDPATIIGYLSGVALSLEKLNDFNLSLTCQSIYKMLLQRIMLKKINPVAFTILFQLMKGYAFNASLQTEIPAKLLQRQKPEAIIKSIVELSKNEQTKFSLKDNYFLENDTLLMSYAGADDPWQGNEPNVRLQNLKMTLDKYLCSKLIPESDDSFDYLLLPEQLQAMLPANTVLICQLLGPSQDGSASLINLMLTREETQVISGKLHDTPSGIVEMTFGDKTLRMPMLSILIEKTRAEIQMEPETTGLTRKAKATMQSNADFFLGGDSLKILEDFRNKGKDHLCIWPHGPLHFFPFHLLPVNGEPLCTDWIISYISNIGILSTNKICNKPSKGIEHELTSMGISFTDNNPYEYLGLSELENSVNEARLIADIFKGDLIVENAVTEEIFIAAMQRSKWLHLSTHGMLDTSAPSFHCLFLHAGNNSDGILNAYELLDYRFDNIDMLTLSACETVLGRFDYSDNMRGLPAILLQCGVKTIIGTLWECEAESSQLFFLSLYTELKKGTSKLEAFTAAQRKVREVFPDYRDWGAFYYTGKFEQPASE